MSISGQVHGIVRTEDATQVVGNDGSTSISYPLDQLQISFSAAMQAQVRVMPLGCMHIGGVITDVSRPATGCAEGRLPIGNFAPAVQAFQAALAALEALPDVDASRSQWKALADEALAAEHISIAIRCYATAGDLARAKYLTTVGGCLSCLSCLSPSSLRQRIVLKTARADGISVAMLRTHVSCNYRSSSMPLQLVRLRICLKRLIQVYEQCWQL